MAAVLAAVAVCYANTLQVPFQFDDESSIVDHPCGAELSCYLRPGAEGMRNRPVAQLSFWLDRRLHGLRVPGFHVVNILVHAAAAGAVLALARLTLRLADRGGDVADRDREAAALLAALLFACHPVQTQAVTYIVQRMASLAAALYLASLLLFARSRLETERPGRRRLLLAAAVVSAVLAMETKETAFTLPLAALLYDLAFLPGPARRRLRALVPMLATLAVVPLSLLRAGTPLSSALSDVAAATRVQTAQSRLDYFVTQWRVVATYLRLLAVPVGQNADPAYPRFHSLGDPAVLASGALLAALVGLAGWLLVRARRPEWRACGFGIAFFFLALSVESSVIPIVDVMFEHRLYLPAAGAALAVSAAGLAVVRDHPGWRGAVAWLAAAWVAVLGGATVARNRVWRDDLSLWSDAAAKSPGNARAHYQLGNAWRERGDLEAAGRAWGRAVELDPACSLAWNQLGNVAALAGDRRLARERYQRAVRADPRNAEAHYNLATVLEHDGEMDAALRHYRAFVERAPAYLAGTAREVRERFGWR